VTVNDQAAMVAAVGEEGFPDPEKLALGLLIERYLRVDPGMDKKR
jgi:hypothetical protein